MTNEQDPEAPGSGNEEDGMVRIEVMLRPEHVALMKGFAAREGATVEALAALWLEEKLDEAVRFSRSSPARDIT